MTHVSGETSISVAAMSQIKGVTNLSALSQKIEEAVNKTVADVLNVILWGGLCLNASDIHIEPEETGAKLRLRLDGVLYDLSSIPAKSFSGLLSRIKLLSTLKLNITDRPQDGRFSLNVENDTPIEIRTSIVPAEYGETVVMRLLNPKNIISIEKLGLRKDLFALFNKEIRKPNGMVIVTGPTGSGKTTTLYAFLKAIQSPKVKIITIEDPIEYHLKGISQTQVSRNYDFANGLKAVVRQDPDVILVGEIRDSQTCDIALQAALTGHLVLTTLHTNDAAGTIARLIALGAKPYNIGPAINIAVAQRLARKICPNCAALEKVTPAELHILKDGLKSAQSKIKIAPLNDELRIPKTKGCAKCSDTGYKDRIGIFEAFIVDSKMEKLILQTSSIAEIRNFAIEKGMITMRQDGLIKTLEGITTLDEIERVTAEKD